MYAVSRCNARVYKEESWASGHQSPGDTLSTRGQDLLNEHVQHVFSILIFWAHTLQLVLGV